MRLICPNPEGRLIGPHDPSQNARTKSASKPIYFTLMPLLLYSSRPRKHRTLRRRFCQSFGRIAHAVTAASFSVMISPAAVPQVALEPSAPEAELQENASQSTTHSSEKGTLKQGEALCIQITRNGSFVGTKPASNKPAVPSVTPSPPCTTSPSFPDLKDFIREVIQQELLQAPKPPPSTQTSTPLTSQPSPTNTTSPNPEPNNSSQAQNLPQAIGLPQMQQLSKESPSQIAPPNFFLSTVQMQQPNGQAPYAQLIFAPPPELLTVTTIDTPQNAAQVTPNVAPVPKPSPQQLPAQTLQQQNVLPASPLAVANPLLNCFGLPFVNQPPAQPAPKQAPKPAPPQINQHLQHSTALTLHHLNQGDLLLFSANDRTRIGQLQNSAMVLLPQPKQKKPRSPPKTKPKRCYHYHSHHCVNRRRVPKKKSTPPPAKLKKPSNPNVNDWEEALNILASN